MKDGTWIDRIVGTVVKAIDARIAKPTGSFTEKGKVIRVDNGYAWVQLPSYDKPTPIHMTVNAEVGDIVEVYVEDHAGTITGSFTHPPTDDKVANEAKEDAKKALKRANEANAAADNAVIKAENSIASDTPHYLATSLDSGVTKETPGWTDTIQTMTETNRYLWTYHTYTLINGNTTDTDPIIIGIYGDTGTSVAGVTEYYLATSLSSGVTTSTPGWTTTIQTTTTTNKYLWNYEVVTDADGNVINTTTPVIIGTHGENGESIASIVEYYLASSSSSGVTTSTPGWTTTVQATTRTKRYLWNYEKVYGSLGTLLNTTDPVIIGTHGEDGTPGGTGPQGVGVASVEPQYYLSTSSSSPVGGSWTSTLTYASGYYIWTREKITYDDTPATVTYSTAIYNQALTEACSLSENTAQYFWIKDSGGTTACPTGTYVTEVPRANYDPSEGGTPTLGSVLIRSGEIFIRAGAVTMLQILAAGITMFNSSSKKLVEYLSSGTTIYDGNDHEIAHLGYGEGNAREGAKKNAPYFTFGSRELPDTDVAAKTYYIGDAVIHNRVKYVYKYSSGTSGHSTSDTTYWVRADTATDYSSSTSYSRGTLVLYEDKTYIYKYSSSSSGKLPTNTTYWTEVKLADSYMSSITYSRGMCVLYTSSGVQRTYIYIYSTSSSNKTPTNTTYWQLLVGNNSVAEGEYVIASGDCTHAEGSEAKAVGDCSHAEGLGSTAFGAAAHAEGAYTEATGSASHAAGEFTVAGYEGQTVVGLYNDNKSDNLFEVGNGSTFTPRSNAFEVSKTGKIKCNNLDPFTTFTATGSTSGNISSGAGGHITCTGTVPTGYIPIAIIKATTNHTFSGAISHMELTSDGAKLDVINSGSSQSFTGIVIILCTNMQSTALV